VRKLTLTAAALALLLAALPAGADEHDPPKHIECPPADGRELLTVDGWEATTNGALPLPDPGAVRDATENRLTPFRNGFFAFQAAFGASPSAQAQFTLTWDDPASDYDLWVLEEDDGLWPLGISQDENLSTEQAREQVTAALGACMRVQVWVRNYLGDPNEELTLTIDVTPSGDPGEPVVDTRRFLYLDSDRPGQLSMAHTQADVIPFRAWLSEERPTEGNPNSYTRTLVGFNAHRNPFQAFYDFQDDDEPPIVGDASALVWVSSATMADHEGTLWAQLYVEGTLVGEVEVPGVELTDTPQPLFVSFPDIDEAFSWQVTFQVSAEPVAASSGDTSPPGNAQFTVWYDSVQFPSVLILP
jgi:hypothetical protein